MKIDLAIAVILGLFGLFGLVGGAIKQLGHFGGLIVAYALARPAATYGAPLAAKKLGLSPLFAGLGCQLAAFFALYILGALVTRVVLRRVFPNGEQGALNRLGGLVLGAGKAALVLAVVLSALVFLEKPVGNLWGDFRRETKQSIAMAFVRRHNVFSTLPQIEGMAKLTRTLRSPEATAAMANDPDFKALSKDPRIRSMANDQAVTRAFENGDVSALMGSFRVLELLNDPSASARLSRFASASVPAVAAGAPAGQ